jgi:hypothetical protein
MTYSKLSIRKIVELNKNLGSENIK